MDRCSNPYCRAGTCFGPHAPAPHPCKACIARWLVESESVCAEAEMLVIVENGSRASRAALGLAQFLRANVVERALRAGLVSS